MSEPRQWSAISREQFEAYLADADRLISTAEDLKIHTFAAALAGVAFIRNALKKMGGDVGWWIAFIRTGMLPGLEWPKWKEEARRPPS